MNEHLRFPIRKIYAEISVFNLRIKRVVYIGVAENNRYIRCIICGD